MDLSEVVSSVYADSAEAHSAFHAGHHDKAEEYLASIENDIGQYVRENPKPPGGVTESPTSEADAETLTETQEQVSAPGVQPAVIDPAAAAQPAPGHLGNGKLNQ